MATHSLRARLLRVLVPPVAVLLGAGAIAAYFLALGPANDAYDQALVDVGLALGERVRSSDAGYSFDLPSATEHALRTDKYDTIYYSVRTPDGAPLAGEPGLPPAPAAGTADDGVIAYDGEYRGQRIRLVAVLVPCGDRSCTVQVAETTRKRRTLARDIALTSFVPALAIALFALSIVWFGIQRGLEPLEALSAEIHARSARDLRPIDPADAPAEAKPLVEGLNQLLLQLAEANRNQQRFLANAAHQLRTPLAGLQAHTELALAQQPDGPVREELRHVHEATIRTARLAAQLLALARAEPGGNRSRALLPVDLRQVVQQSADDWVHRALEKEIDFGFDLAEAAVPGDEFLLGEAYANLAHNALEYTPRGGNVTARTGMRDGRAFLEVEDDGPGIAAAERDRVLERFYRVAGSPGSGSGLGLAVVREIALAHAAELEIESGAGGRGCLARLVFPPRA